MVGQSLVSEWGHSFRFFLFLFKLMQTLKHKHACRINVESFFACCCCAIFMHNYTCFKLYHSLYVCICIKDGLSESAKHGSKLPPQPKAQHPSLTKKKPRLKKYWWV